MDGRFTPAVSRGCGPTGSSSPHASATHDGACPTAAQKRRQRVKATGQKRHNKPDAYPLLRELVRALLSRATAALQDIQHTLLVRGKASDLTDDVTHDADAFVLDLPT